ncbi:hypothetical protein VNO77_10758 [Canavalia gladiata]|uniref:Uncharacterized protein n=1 Tax=Canavalia gladiata TaxID=3824 RepID=A0AAN9QXU8_CANGL
MGPQFPSLYYAPCTMQSPSTLIEPAAVTEVKIVDGPHSLRRVLQPHGPPLPLLLPCGPTNPGACDGPQDLQVTWRAGNCGKGQGEGYVPPTPPIYNFTYVFVLIGK